MARKLYSTFEESVIAMVIPNLHFEIQQIDKLALLISDLKRNHADTANERG